MFDPDKGDALRYVPISTIDEVKCTEIDKEDIQSEIDYWRNVVLYYDLTANPSHEVMNGFVKRI